MAADDLSALLGGARARERWQSMTQMSDEELHWVFSSACGLVDDVQSAGAPPMLAFQTLLLAFMVGCTACRMSKDDIRAFIEQYSGLLHDLASYHWQSVSPLTQLPGVAANDIAQYVDGAESSHEAVTRALKDETQH